MNLGLFYQSGYRIEACYYALKQFRKFYPKSPISLYEDNSRILKPVANKFNCSYKVTNKPGFNDFNSGRPAFNIETTTAWLDRVYEACITTLKSVEWVMNMEDDVWFLGKINSPPPFDLTGIGGMGWQDERLYKFVKTSKRGAYGCGGSIFNRLKFIEAYKTTKNIDWEYIESIAGKGSPTQWTDSMLTFIFMFNKFTVGSDNSISMQYQSETIHWDELTPKDINKVEKEHLDTKVIHCWKPYYNPPEDIIKKVKLDLALYEL